MKKQLLTIIGLALFAGAVQAQISTNEAINALAQSITINVSESANAITYTVTVPRAASAVLNGAQHAGEAREDYVRRAFVAGATGLLQQKAMLAARAAALTNALAQAQSKLQVDTAKVVADSEAAKAKVVADSLTRQTSISNQLNSVTSQLR